MLIHTTSLKEIELASAIVRNPLVATPETTVIEAIAQMSGVRTLCQASQATDPQEENEIEARSSCLVVVEDSQVVGIFTERDVVRLITQQLSLDTLTLREVMTRSVVTLHESKFTDLFSAVNLLRQHRIRHLPLLDDHNQLVGLLTHESLQQTSNPIDLLRLRLVAEVMTTGVVCADRALAMRNIAGLMSEHRVSSVVVVDPHPSHPTRQIPIGIVTERDVVQFQALRLALETCPAQAVMSTPLFSVQPEDSLWVVQQLMTQHRIQRLVVTGSEGELVGIVTQSSLLQALNPLEIYKLAETLEQKVLRLEAEKIEFLENRTIYLEQQIKERAAKLQAKATQEQLVATIASQIRLSLDLPEILNTTVNKLHTILGCDRVAIWQIQPDGHLLSVAESISSAVSSRLGQQIYDTCFLPDRSAAYRHGTVRVVPDINTEELTDCHRALLEDLQTCAKVVVAVVQGDRLWGLLEAMSRTARQWQPEEVSLLEQLATQLAIAIQQATAHQQLQTELQATETAKALIQHQLTELTAWRNRYEAVGRVTVQVLYEFTFATGLITWGKNTELILGCGTSQLPMQLPGWIELIHPEDRSQFEQALANNRTHKIDFFAQYRVKHHDGHYLWIEDRNQWLFDDKGEEIGVIGAIADISDRKRDELQLQQLNRSLEAQVQTRTQELQTVNKLQRAFLDSTDYAIITTNLKGIIQTFNAGAEKMLGYSAAEVVGQVTPLLFHDPQEIAEKASVLSAELGKEISAGLEVVMVQANLRSGYEQEWINICKDGSRIAIALTITELKDANNENIGYLGVAKDISDRKRAERALQSSEERFRRIFDSSVVGMVFADFEGHILDANDRFLVMLGYTRQELESGTIDWLAMTPPEYLAKDYACMKELLEKGEVEPWEKEYYRKDGSRISILIGAAFLEGSNNETICVILDISDQKEAERTIRQQANQESLLRKITQRIRESLDLHTIFDTACVEIRHLLQADRVGIFQFYPNSHYGDGDYGDGEFVAESVVDGLTSALEVRVHDHCFGENYSTAYAQGWFQVVDNLETANLEPCYKTVLSQFQVQANLVMPLLCGTELWGLLCVHQCSAPRHWQDFEIDVTQQISQQLAIAIQQANLYDQLQRELLVRQEAEAKIALQLRQQKIVSEIVKHIRESLNINEILWRVTEQVREMLQADRVIVLQLFADGKSQIVEESVHNDFPILKAMYWENEVWSQDILDYYWQGQPRIVPDVTQDVWTDCLLEYSHTGQIQSKIVAPIIQEPNKMENSRWIDGAFSNKLWGVLVVHACAEKRLWSDSEAQLLQQVANQLAIAIQQATLFEQLSQSNQHLARATRLKDEFLANMSHELRTPLNAIMGMTEGLQEQVFGTVNDKQIKALQTVEKSAAHLLSLINDILDVAKIESGQTELELTWVDVSPLCSSSLAFIKQQALQKHIQLKTKLPASLPQLFIDERRIRQVLINLLTNAVKFTPREGQIKSQVSHLAHQETFSNQEKSIEQHYLRIAVIDTGIGIRAENLKKLFQPFVQIDTALNRQYEGTGLGLALVKQIVELHGGRVGVTSEFGVGSCFRIDLPCEATVIPDLDPTPAIATRGNLCPTDCDRLSSQQCSLILLAEDNIANISTVASYLEVKGYRLLLAHNGQEAIDLAQASNPDLILMDIQMPKVDGLEAIQRIRQDPKLVHTPIIALTALAMTGDRERCLAAGANDYLSKPVRLKQLAATIEQFLR